MKTRHMTLQITYHMTKKWHHHYCHGHNGEPTYCKYNWYQCAKPPASQHLTGWVRFRVLICAANHGMFVHSFLASIKRYFLFSAFLSDKAWTINLQAMSCEIIWLCETIHWSTCKTHVMWIPNWENLKNYLKGEYWVYSHLTGSVKWWCWEVCQMILCLILIWNVSQDSLASYDPGYDLL